MPKPVRILVLMMSGLLIGMLVATQQQPVATAVPDRTGSDSPPHLTSPPEAQSPRFLVLLEDLEVADPDPARSKYVRTDYTTGWRDTTGNCRTLRHEILFDTSEIEPETTDDGCQVVSGKWTDPYTGEILLTAEEATIDHHVPLAEAHYSGAWRWDAETKQRFSHDRTAGQLTVVGKAVNLRKAAQRPDQWLPPLYESHCVYVQDWVAVKHLWRLSVTEQEAKTLRSVLTNCNSGTPPLGIAAPPAPPIGTTTTSPTNTTGGANSGVAGLINLVSCDRQNESVIIANRGLTEVSLERYTLHDEGNKHSVSLGRFGTLQSGSSLTVLSGPDASEGSTQAVWKRHYVWNNDGDIAFLVAPDGSTAQVRC